MKILKYGQHLTTQKEQAYQKGPRRSINEKRQGIGKWIQW